MVVARGAQSEQQGAPGGDRDPLAQLGRLSWPATASLHVDASARRVLVLGDVHQSLRKSCAACEHDAGCATVSALLRDLAHAALAAGTHLDVFAEVQLVSALRLSQREAALHVLSARRALLSSPMARLRRRALEAVGMDTVLGDHPGYLFRVFSDFKREFLAPSQAWVSSGVRFHLADARVDEVLALLALDVRGVLMAGGQRAAPFGVATPERLSRAARMYAAYPTLADVDSAVERLCLGRLGARGLEGRLRAHPLVSPDGRYKTSKQVAKLAPADRAHVEAFFRGSLLPPAPAEAERHYARVRDGGDARAMYLFACHVLLARTLPVMDVYLLARLVHYVRRQPPGSTTVVYAGERHAQAYRAFLAALPGFAHADGGRWAPCGELRPAGSAGAARCVHMDRCAALAARGRHIKAARIVG